MYQPDVFSASEGVAIIGMSGRFPGADNIDELWRSLVAGREGIVRYSTEELVRAGVPRRLAEDSAYVPVGHPLAGPERFDAEFFDIPPAEAGLMDPQHRLLLEEGWHALEHAGYRPYRPGARTAVFASVSGSGSPVDVRGSEAAGQLQSMTATNPGTASLRLSYKLGLTGPSLTVQSTCSSSLVAVHLAVQSLLSLESDLALAGGASVHQFAPGGHRHEPGMISSPDGHCRPFDAGAGGTMPGDGVALVVLKRLGDALADGDHIFAVIRGSAVNNDGSGKAGFTAPSPDGQAGVIAEALAVAGVDPATIQYIEAHGTATALGDAVEVRALREIFGGGAHPGSCFLGSVKSNLGHLDAAAGVTGLIKATLALEHRWIPPTLHFTTPNPELRLEETPFHVNAQGVPWPHAEHPRRAGVSAFGVGGTNAHVVVEAAPARRRDETHAPRRGWHLLPLSARTPAALDRTIDKLARHLTDADPPRLADVAYTLQVGRVGLPYRQAVICDGVQGAVSALTGIGSRHAPAGRAPEVAPPVAFLLPGQGSQYAGMGADLYATEPAFREALDECADLLRPHVAWNLRDVLFAVDDAAASRLRQTGYTQPAVFTLDYALARLLLAWGVRPAGLLGHSVGEFVAACLSGVFSLADALRLVALRGQLMDELEPGRMLAVRMAEADLVPLLDGAATVAAVNGPRSCVVAGPVADVERIGRVLAERSVSVRELDTSHAFHTALVEPALPRLADALRTVRLNRPQIPFVSGMTGTWIGEAQATDPDYWVAATRQPVRFGDGVVALARHAGMVLVEVGPGSALSGLARENAARLDADGQAVVTLLGRGNAPVPQESRSMLEGIAELWRRGVPVDWAALHRSPAPLRVPLPGYPFEGRAYPSTPAGSPAPDGQPRLYVPVWHPAAAPRTAAVPTSTWLVLADDLGLSGRLVAMLRDRRQRVVVARVWTEYERLAADEFRVDPSRQDHLERLVRELRGSGDHPDRVVHAWSVLSELPDEPGARVDTALAAGFHSLRWIVDALRGADSPPSHVDVLTNDLCEVAGSPVRLPERAVVYGTLSALPLEHPGITCRSIDVQLPDDDAAWAALARQLTAELLAPGRGHVAYRAGRRLRQAFAPVEPEPLGDGVAWRSDGGYLITGVSQPAGLAVAERLAVLGARLVLVTEPGFPAPDERAAQPSANGIGATATRLDALLAAHRDTITLLRADVADPVGARSAVEQARAALGPVNGVLHMLDPGTLTPAAEKAPPPHPVLRQRMLSILLLSQLLRVEELDFLLLDSSLTGVRGGTDEPERPAAEFAEKGAAAAFLDAFALANTALGGRVVAFDRQEPQIGWPDAFDLAQAAVNIGGGQVVACTVDLPGLVARGGTSAALAAADPPRGASVVNDPDGWDPVALWPNDKVAQEVARTLRSILGAEAISQDDDFYQLGGNSLSAIQVASRLRLQYGDFPISALFEAPTVSGIAGAIRAYQAELLGLDEFESLLSEVEGLLPDEVPSGLEGENA